MIIDLIESLLNKGRTFEAYNELESALKDDPDNIRLQQLSGLTSARLGLLERAKKIMENLAGKENDSETSGILGRIYKDFWKTTGDLYYLDLSINTYMKAFLETKNGYNGINAASLTYLSGRREDAIKLAKETIIYVEQWDNDYWKEATLGEAFLLCGDTKAARKHYLNAVESGKSVPGSIHSTVEQLKLLSAVIPDAEEMRNLFDEINVVIFAGHMIDSPSGNTVRFPEYAAEKVKKQIGAFLDRIKANIGFSSLACGGDILFAESILERGLELNIIFPFKIDDFLKTSVDFASLQWKERFNAVLSKAHNIKFTTIEGYQGDDFLFDLCARQTMGLGILRAGLFSSRPWFLTVWNGETGNTGGTAHSVNWFPWPERHFNIHPGELNKIIHHLMQHPFLYLTLQTHNIDVK
jgi:tetratricopeptide (TPR) repeat protein